MEMCLDDARQDPLKYKPFYPCDFDAVIAPKLSAMEGGRRLPLRGTRTPLADLVDRLTSAHLDLNKVYALVISALWQNSVSIAHTLIQDSRVVLR
jgi:hypothetical protein